MSLPDTAPLPRARGATFIVEHEDDELIVLRHQASARPNGDGDRDHDWIGRLTRPLRLMRGVGIVGAKRVDNAGRIHSMGEMVIHPKGFHSLGRGLPAAAHRFAEEVDAISGGVLAVGRGLYEELGGASAFASPFDALMSGLEARRTGRRVLTVPSVQVVESSDPSPSAEDERRFTLRFGFSVFGADLDQVAQLHAGSGLLWNPRWFAGTDHDYDKYRHRPYLHWQAFRSTPVYRSRAEAIVGFLAAELRAGSPEGSPRLLDLGCGDGLFSWLLAAQGFEVTGADVESPGIEQARSAPASEFGLSRAPEFILIDLAEVDPPHAIHPTIRDRGPFDAVVMLDVIEHLSNPASLLRGLREVIRPGGRLALSTPEAQVGRWSDPLHHVCEFTHGELHGLLRQTGWHVQRDARIGEPYRDLIVIAQ